MPLADGNKEPYIYKSDLDYIVDNQKYWEGTDFKAAHAAIRAAIERQMKEWGFASYHTAWHHFARNAEGAVVNVMSMSWNDLESGFKKRMHFEKKLDTSFLNTRTALVIEDIHNAELVRHPLSGIPPAPEKAAEVNERIPQLLADIGFKDRQEIQDILSLALFRVGARAAARELKNHGKNIDLGAGL